MLVKFFKHKPTSSPRASINYLLNKPEGKFEVLSGDPDLSLAIAESLEFSNRYTVGCLSFEEPDIPEKAKQEIMDRFETTLFSGLDKEQYNICWIQHTDKDRLELNFFIPNVEMTQGKRLQPYYDKADRPLVENFKQVINHEYRLSDPNDPQKQQTTITSNNIPKEKKKAVAAINGYITTLAENGSITNRKDVITALENAGFEIARKTPKNISIKNPDGGQNIRLKGAFYEQSFKLDQQARTERKRAVDEYDKTATERYQTARERLNSAVERRHQFNIEKHRKRTSQIIETDDLTMENAFLHNWGNNNNNASGNRGTDVHRNKQLQQYDEVEQISGDSQAGIRESEFITLQNQRNRKPSVHRGRSKIQTNLNERKGQNVSNHQNSGVKQDEHSKTIRKHIEDFVTRATQRTKIFIKAVTVFTRRKCLDQTTIQRNQLAISRNHNTIRELTTFTQRISEKLEQKRQEKQGFEL